MSRIIIALGGNAIIQRDQLGTVSEQTKNIEVACRQIAKLVKCGHSLCVTHGNGPQVGNILLQNEEAYKALAIPPMPLDVCGAESQGLIGYLMQQCLKSELESASIQANVVTVVTQVLVDREDPAFSNPEKPIGPFYTEARARKLMSQRGYVMKQDVFSRYRRVVPSPDPKAIIERDIIRKLVDGGDVVICSGGGGIPVVRGIDGRLHGVEAVIDKDLAAERLATDLGAETLVILTDVEKVATNFGKRTQQSIDRATNRDIRTWQEQGHFRPGSMWPKVEAAARFVEHGGREAIITSLNHADTALEGSGTHISKTA